MFGRGRRREYVLESDCARELTEFFKRQIGMDLYDHVAELLKITFPETCDMWWRGKKRGADAVRQILHEQDAPKLRKKN